MLHTDVFKIFGGYKCMVSFSEQDTSTLPQYYPQHTTADHSSAQCKWKSLHTAAGLPVAVERETLFTSTLVRSWRAGADLLAVVVSSGTQVRHHCKRRSRLKPETVSRPLDPEPTGLIHSRICPIDSMITQATLQQDRVVTLG